MVAGYSGTPLPGKLGIKPRHRVTLINAPNGFLKALSPMPQDVDVRSDLRSRIQSDVILVFCGTVAELNRRVKTLINRLKPDGGLWICWPKKASGVATDVTESIVRSTGLEAGLVDNKICAIDDTWSGLRFVFRLKDRPKQ